MNINQAKNYIKDSIQIYLKKDEFGEYRIPVVRQRPIFLLGSPGIGKTAKRKRTIGSRPGADCTGNGNCVGVLFHDPPYQAVRFGASLYQGEGIWGKKV